MSLRLVDVSLWLSGRPLITGLTLDVAAGEVVTLMGPSGAGKSSLLSFIGGELAPPFSASGKVYLAGSDLDGIPAERRRIGRMFQDDLLFPHMTIEENLLFGMPRGDSSVRRAAAREALVKAGLAGMEHRQPSTLSGGQRSRAALLRTLLAEPRAVLLDEPFARLDAGTKAQIRQFTFERLRACGIPVLLVTHDPADAPDGGAILTIGADGQVTHA
jgi:putative thiamine transport system ATP-binding protein